jgi:hypothetical protein
MFPEKEVELQISDINKMLFPDTVKDKLIQLGMKEKPVEETLEGLCRTDYPFTKTIQHIQIKIQSLLDNQDLYLEFKCDNTDKIYRTELGQLLDNISILSHQLQQCEKLIDSFILTTKDLEILLSTAFIIGRLTGYHDMKMVLQRHTENGVKSRVRTPKIATAALQEKYKKVNHLILNMLGFVNEISNFKIKQVDVKDAIFGILKNFTSINNHEKLEAFNGFSSKYPSLKHIEKLITGKNRTLKNKEVMSRLTIKTLLSEQYSHCHILKIITDESNV